MLNEYFVFNAITKNFSDSIKSNRNKELFLMNMVRTVGLEPTTHIEHWLATPGLYLFVNILW